MLFASVGLLNAPASALGVPFREADKYYLQKPKSPVAWDKTFVTFSEFRGSWSSTIQTFAKVADMKLVEAYPAPDHIACGLNGRIDNSKVYSLVEAFDIINEIMLGETKHGLIRSGNKLYLIPLDVNFHDGPRCDRVALQDLPGRGRTEIVEMVVKLNPDIQKQTKQLLGEFGQVWPLENGECVLRGSVGSLTLVARIYGWK